MIQLDFLCPFAFILQGRTVLGEGKVRDGVTSARHATRVGGAERRIGMAGWATCAIALAGLSSCNASETTAPPANWALLSETGEAFALVNTEVVAGESPAIWAATVYKPTSGLSDEGVAVSQRRYRFKCQNSVGRIDYAASYNRYGEPLGEGSVREADHPFVPNSVGDALMKLACGHSDLPRPTEASPLGWLASPDEWVAAEADAAADAAAEAAARAASVSLPDGDGITDLNGDAYLEAILGEPLETYSPDNANAEPDVIQ